LTALLFEQLSLIGPLRTDKRNFAANGRWGEHHAGNHKGKRHTDKE
jgi:hypothetical protein